MRRVFFPLVLLICSATAGSAGEVVGLSLPLTGSLSPIAQRMNVGATRALQHLKDQGQSVELVTVDDGCDANTVAQSAQAFTAARVNIVVGPLCFKIAVALAEALRQPANQDNPVPVVAVNNRNKLLERLRDVDELPLYSLSNAPYSEAKAVVDLILPRFKKRPFAILDDGSVYGRALAEDLRLQGELVGQRAILSTNFRPLQTSQISLLRRLKKSGVEAVFIAATADDVVTITDDMKALKLDWMVATGERGQLLPYTTGLNSNLAGVLAVRERNLVTDQTREIMGDLGEADLENSHLLGHALVEIGATAARRGLKDLVGHSFNTIIGPVKFDQSGLASPAPFIATQWQNGTFETLDVD
jgi:branched-chain amino acid transport system substrate-binding protein